MITVALAQEVPPEQDNPWRPYPNPTKDPAKFILVSLAVLMGFLFLTHLLKGCDNNKNFPNFPKTSEQEVRYDDRS